MQVPSPVVGRALLGMAIVSTCVLFTRQALDPVNVIKLTALLVIAILLLAVGTWGAAGRRRVDLPLAPAALLAAGLLVCFVLAAVTAPMSTTAVLGTYGRNSGLLAYLAALVLFFGGLVTLSQRSGTVVASISLAGLFTSTYGLLQFVGVDSVPWNNPFNPVIGTLGNPNFASAYMGIAATVGVGAALDRRWHPAWRATFGVSATLCLLAATLSNSVQGPLAAAGGLFVVALALALNASPARRRISLAALSAAAVAALTLLLVGALAKAGPAGPIFVDSGSQARPHYWSGALNMLRTDPLFGVGLDHYGAFWRSARSVGSITALGGGQFSDAAHSVPLQMFAQGGLLLGLTYAAFVVAVLVALIRGLLGLEPTQRTSLAAVGGGWVAYQVQAAVSIDHVPLIVLHFVLASAVIVSAGPVRIRRLHLPGFVPPAPPVRAKRRRALAAAERRRLSGIDLAIAGGTLVMTISALWFALVPLRANMAAQDGEALLAQGFGSGALAAYERAQALVPGQALYVTKEAQLFLSATPPQPGRALAAFERAVRLDPYDLPSLRAAALLAEDSGDVDLARRLHRKSAALDPLNPESVVSAATFELRHQGADAALVLLRRLTAVLPSSAAAFASMGDALLVTGEGDAARDAYQEALRLQPGEPTAVAGLEKLPK